MRWKIPEQSLSQNELALWLHLTNMPGIGPVKGANLLQRYTVYELSGCTGSQLTGLGWSEQQIRQWFAFSVEQYQPILDWGSISGHHILPFDHPSYPSLLRNVAGAPLVLFIAGNIAVTDQVQLAVVGSRKPTQDGMQHSSSPESWFSMDLSLLRDWRPVSMPSVIKQLCNTMVRRLLFRVVVWRIFIRRNIDGWPGRLWIRVAP